MTVLLVLFTLIAFLVADYVVQQRKQRALHAAAVRTSPLLAAGSLELADDLLLTPNHLWLRRERNNSITVGIDNFLLGLTGDVERIDLPKEGQMIGAGEQTILLRDKDKHLAVNVPIEGQVVAVNKEVLQRPSVAGANPYVSGWLFNILPADEGSSLASFLHGKAAGDWLKKQNDLVKEFLLSSTPRFAFATMQDGGLPARGVLKSYDAGVWREFEKKFLTVDTGTRQNGEYGHA